MDHNLEDGGGRFVHNVEDRGGRRRSVGASKLTRSGRKICFHNADPWMSHPFPGSNMFSRLVF
eukprot:6370019-Pyramimonas_sp.AAC.1